MLRWLKGQGAKPPEVARMQARIPSDLWRQVLAEQPFLASLTPAEAQGLLSHVAWLLASKTMNGAQGLALNNAMRLSIAAQACLPVLNLSPSLYEGWDEIIVYPEGFSVQRELQDDDGILHEYQDEVLGEAWEGGPLILSWQDTDADAHQLTGAACNVVIHEFVHKLDQQSGVADGTPGLSAHPELDAAAWRQVLDRSLADFSAAVDAVDLTIPHDMDPESDEAQRRYASLPLDPYAASDPAEFFAVSSEQFFVDPAPLARAFPDWYALLERYYRQNTLQRLT